MLPVNLRYGLMTEGSSVVFFGAAYEPHGVVVIGQLPRERFSK
jgi:hypothetical protein